MSLTRVKNITDTLTVSGTTTLNNATTVNNNLTVNTDADTSIEFKDGGTNAAFMTAATGDELYIGANNEYAIRIKSDGTKDVAFDNGSRVTMPSQPSFSRRGQYGWQTKSSVDNIGSWYDGYDNTNMLNAGTGVATAPVARFHSLDEIKLLESSYTLNAAVFGPEEPWFKALKAILLIPKPIGMVNF